MSVPGQPIPLALLPRYALVRLKPGGPVHLKCEGELFLYPTGQRPQPLPRFGGMYVETTLRYGSEPTRRRHTRRRAELSVLQAITATGLGSGARLVDEVYQYAQGFPGSTEHLPRAYRSTTAFIRLTNSMLARQLIARSVLTQFTARKGIAVTTLGIEQLILAGALVGQPN